MHGENPAETLSPQRGFSLFEMVVVVLLIGVLMSMAIDRMLQLQISSERISVQHMLGVLNSAVNLQAAERVVKQGLDSLTALEHTNPMQYLQNPPYNYLGIKDDKAAGGYPANSWYYDAEQNILVYTVKNTNYFSTSLAGTPRIRLRVTLAYQKGAHPGRNNTVRGVSVKNLEPYSWKFN
ncbi:MAG: prepilin-type N-terminal cleavage/methylation domain-containing protein [Gammaproteobacteria bacterium]|nr:prepilin-type N-terminal cleavage/methylation domain-containing protein [Gammaproteobacteria bacterium]